MIPSFSVFHHTHTYTHIHIHTHTQAHTHTYKQTHTHAHTHTPISEPNYLFISSAFIIVHVQTCFRYIMSLLNCLKWIQQPYLYLCLFNSFIQFTSYQACPRVILSLKHDELRTTTKIVSILFVVKFTWIFGKLEWTIQDQNSKQC